MKSNKVTLRKIIVLSFITLDGVMQAPGGPEEDPSSSFKYGGRVAPYFDEVVDKGMEKQLKPADLLLGRKTFEIFEGFWPQHSANWPGINEATKYVVSGTRETSDWENTIFLRNLTEIKKLKNGSGPDIQVHGSGELI
jgi:dihydrofolate reductase